MKTKFSHRALLTISLSTLGLAHWLNAQSPQKPRLDSSDLKQYIQVTKEPFEMLDTTSTLCRPPTDLRDNPHEPLYPEKAFCHVYVNEIALRTMQAGKGEYPEGSWLIKSKLATRKSTKAELLTVMQKMPAGYDPQHGDWKYSVIDGRTQREIASGRIESCIDCHASYQSTDYVTRTYMNKPRLAYPPE
ncbi:MAG: cytochrome P460 family protein [Pirellula sp.]